MAGIDKTMAKIIRPIDYRSNAGIMARGKNVYPGGLNNAVSGPRTRPKILDDPEALKAYLLRRKARG